MHQRSSPRNTAILDRVANTTPYAALDAFNAFVIHNMRMAHYRAFALPIKEVRGYFGDPQVRAAIEENLGAALLHQIDLSINDIARGAMDPAKVHKLLDKARANFTASILGVKLPIGIKQVPSILAYSLDIGPVKFIEGIADFWDDPVGHYKEMLENSPYTKSRFAAGYERDVKDMMARKDAARTLAAKHNMRDWFLFQVRLGDRLAVVQGQWAVYKARLDERGPDGQPRYTKAEAWAAAEQVTDRTQPTSGMHTLSQLQREGSWGRLLTMFQNQPNKYFRSEVTTLRNMKARRISVRQGLYNLFLTHVVLPVLFQLISDAFRPKKERLARAAVLGPLNGILVVGQVMNNIVDRFEGKWFDWEPSPVLDFFDQIGYGVQKMHKIQRDWQGFDNVNWDDVLAMIERFAIAAGEATGTPTPYGVQAFEAVREGKPEQLIFSEYALQGGEKKTQAKSKTVNVRY